MRRALALGLLVALLGLGAPAASAADPPGPGQTTATVVFDGAAYRYVLTTPSSYDPARPMPLVVVLHGCQTTAEQQLRASLFGPVAEREGFAVLYPDVDAIGRAQPGIANQCWKFPYPPASVRGGSDAGAIAAMTRAVMGRIAVDPERVYVVGMSAGGLMSSIEAAAYPDLYAAAGIVESAGYDDWPCFTTGVGIPVQLSAQLAFAAMGPRARVVPRFVIGSTGDQAFPRTCADKALEQGLRTDNLVLSGTQTAPIALTPAGVRHEQRPGGRSYTVSTYRDPAGCVIGEKTIIDGMPHDWPGGSPDPASKYFTDPTAPNGAEITWAFFRRFTKSATSMPCAEAPVAPQGAVAGPVCRGAWRLVRLPAGARRIRATVDGRRARVRRTRGGVRVRVGSEATATILVTARVHGRRVTRRRTVAGCARTQAASRAPAARGSSGSSPAAQ